MCWHVHTHTYTHMHTYIDILLYTYRYACIYRVYFNQPRPDTTLSPGPDWAALGRTTKQLQIVFSLPPAPYRPLSSTCPLYLCWLHSCWHLFIYSLLPPSASHFQFFACKLEKFKRKIQSTLPKAASKWRLADPKVFHLREGLSSRHGRQADRGKGEECMQPICSICSSSKATDKSNNK